MTLSPWINAARLEAEGMLIVWDTSTRRTPATLQPLVDAGKTGEERFKFSPRGGQPELVIGYAIVPPKRGAALIANLHFRASVMIEKSATSR